MVIREFQKKRGLILICILIISGLFIWNNSLSVKADETDEAEETDELEAKDMFSYDVTDSGIRITGYLSRFKQDKDIIDVEIPEDIDGKRVTEIGDRAFQSAAYIEYIQCPEGLKVIGNASFQGCTKLSDITFPDSLKSIGASAFAGCKSFVNLELPDGVTSIGRAAFQGCSGLESAVLPENLKRLEASVFQDCTSLTYVTLPDGMTEIAAAAFKGCKNLWLVETASGQDFLPEKLETIGKEAFAGCKSLESLEISDSISEIEDTAFDGCSKELVLVGENSNVLKVFADNNHIQYQSTEDDFSGEAQGDEYFDDKAGDQTGGKTSAAGGSKNTGGRSGETGTDGQAPAAAGRGESGDGAEGADVQARGAEGEAAGGTEGALESGPLGDDGFSGAVLDEAGTGLDGTVYAEGAKKRGTAALLIVFACAGISAVFGVKMRPKAEG